MKPFNIKLIALTGLISANFAGQQITLSAGIGNTNSGFFSGELFDLARYNKCENKMKVLRQSLGSLAYHAFEGSFHEFLNFGDGKFRGSPAYIWSNAAYAFCRHRSL